LAAPLSPSSQNTHTSELPSLEDIVLPEDGDSLDSQGSLRTEDTTSPTPNESQDILAEARSRATQICVDAQAEAEGLLRQAHEQIAGLTSQAREEGFSKGQAEGRQAALQEMEGQLNAISALLAAIREERHEAIRAAEPEILRLSLAIAERLVHRHISIDPETLFGVVKHAIAKLNEHDKLTIRIHPNDIDMLQQYRNKLVTIADTHNIRFVEDATVEQGSAAVESTAATVDARFSTQLSQAEQILFEEADRQ
jgi:flagellar assembly protein FliH